MSAHRTPAAVADFASSARDRGTPPSSAAPAWRRTWRARSRGTTLPVIGVPLSGGALNGVGLLYATVQMPKGIPVATVAIDGAMNAAPRGADARHRRGDLERQPW